MVDGIWHAEDALPSGRDGAFQRAETTFRDQLGPDGDFPAEPGRYRLYVSLACPWAHRTLILRRIKRLDGMIGLSVTHWLMGPDGWSFAPGEGVVPDPDGARLLQEVYLRASPRFTGRVTVPVLWDTRTRRIVSNESAEIVRMFNASFDALGAEAGDYRPQALRGEIDAVNDRVYACVNNGVYRAGFARTQAAHDRAVDELFEALDWLESRLRRSPFLCGGVLTEADWRLFPTLARFDSAYVGHFKCDRRRLVDHPALWAYARLLHSIPGIAGTVDLGHIRRHYYLSHPWLDPSGIVPGGPALAWPTPDSGPQARALTRPGAAAEAGWREGAGWAARLDGV